MKPTILTLILSALLLGAVPGPGAGPALAARGRDVEAEIERTDRVLDQALDIVAQAFDPRPAKLLDLARQDQQEARQAIVDENPRRARLLTLGARQRALRAIELVKSQIRLLGRVREILFENRELVRETREAVEASGDPGAARLLEAGIRELARGQRAFNDHQYRQAVRLSLFGRDLVLRAARLADGERDLTAARVRDEIERTDEFLRAARAAVEDAGSARARIEESQRFQTEATQQLRRGNLERARWLSVHARDIALDVLREEGGEPTTADVDALLDRVTARLSELRTGARDTDDREVTHTLEQAEAHLARAREAMAENDLRVAFAEAQLASSLLGQAASRRR